jgi:uncharacterized protein (DUF1800 family)
VIGQISTMGEPIFQYQAPTGYPEDSHRWVSSGALISRLNYSLALTGGKISGVQLPRIDRDDATLAKSDAAVDRIATQILGGNLSASTKQTLLRQVQDTPAEMNVSSASNVSSTSRLIALMLGSPEFQRR